MRRPADDHTGARIADYRKLRHLTQAGLAQRAFVSRGTIAKIEAGLSPASPAVVAAVARALEVDVAVLNGQPYLEEMRQDQLDRMIAPLTYALDTYDLGPDPGIRPRPLQQVSAEVDELCKAACATEYTRTGDRLPALLSELTTIISGLPEGAERRRAAAQLAWCYWVAYEFAYRLGFHHLASIALERMGFMGEQAQDPLLLALRLQRRSSMLLRRSDNPMALRVLDHAHQLVAQHDAPRSVPALAVSGSLHLAGAIATAQAKNAEDVKERMTEARAVADRIGRDVPLVYWASFGLTSVAHFDVATAVELGQLGEAMKSARKVRFPADHPRMRVGRYHMELARAYSRMGRSEAAQEELFRAREAAPQQARYHPLMRETVGVLVRRSRAVPGTLASLAAWVGL
ncbi:helix-turn-helix transcriptional regulator [Streptomyces sp. MP131-18]|uniref:helix-turn-helix domain-containing protein n=1 Tax=Streptomyces sp. MP131-18 TaxID=1857892 RepID=UPI00097C96ED|nr:helix-turn-helix transcriptional regulator [Streptomyces sp. MP131-18]ONK15499.1 anaerobic benzoate catabolism transcriptional regulator [Streptomyces sp. MP131-18]